MRDDGEQDGSGRVKRRRLSILKAALLAVLSGFATLGALGSFPSTAAAQEQPMLDLERLKTLPLIEVIRSGTGRYVVRLTYSPHEPQARFEGKTPLAALEDLDPELRCLTWLMFLAHGWLVPDATDWLHAFFFAESGDFAPQVRDALKQAGLSAQHQVFSEAMASFGQSYPLAHDGRKAYSAWWSGADRPPTALDRKLLALNAAFGSRSDYDNAVEGYVARNPKLVLWAQDRRPKVRDEDRLMWLTLQLHRYVDPYPSSNPSSRQKLSLLPRPHQQLIHLDIFWVQVFNGGVEQFFLNSSGDVAPEVAQALNDVGLDKEAQTVRQGIDLFPSPYPADRQQRHRLLAGRKGRAIDKKLYDLGDRVDSRATGRVMIDLAKREGLLPQ